MANDLKSLFQPIEIGKLTARNRVVMPPMNTNMAYGDGFASERNRDYYAERAKGGAAVVILEAIFIEWAAKHRTFGMGVSEDKYIPGLKMVAEGIQAHGGLAVAQINHNGRILSEDVTGLQTVAPTTFANPATGEVSIEFTTEEVEEIIEKYAQAALRVKKAGFDGVEVHCAHGYLLAQFISPFTNKRTDKYGGSLKNRMRAPLAVVRRVKELCGADYPVFVRISGDEYFQGGQTLENSVILAKELEAAGVDCLDVSGSSLEGPPKLAKVIPCHYLDKGFHIPSATAIKAAVSIPVIGVGRINDPAQAASYIDEGRVDMVAIGRQLIADPHWAAKAAEGRPQEIRTCIACNVCLDILLANKRPLTCVVNPDAGCEATAVPDQAAEPKKVAVVGAGPAGLEAARMAAARGHQVTVYDRGSDLGGQLILAAAAPGKEEIATIPAWYRDQLAKLKVTVNLGTEVTPAVLDELGPEAVVIATGGRPSELEADWAGSTETIMAWDILSGEVRAGDKVVIIGSNRVALETAEFLLARDKEVIIVARAARIGADLGLTVRPVMMNRLIRSRVNVFNNAEVTGVEGHDVILDRNGDGITLRDVDSIVLAVGTESESGLADELSGKPFQVEAIGDCVKVGGIMDAIHAGAELGKQL